MPIFLVFFTYALWSSIFTVGKATLAYASPLFLTGSRMLVAGFLLVLFLAIFDRKTLKIKTKQQWLSIFLLGFFSVYLANALEFWGLQYLTAGKTCLIYSLTPFISAVLSYFQFGEKITWRKAAGLGIGFLSFIPIIMDGGGSESLSGLGILSWAELALMLAAISAAYGWILLKSLGTQQATSPIASNALSMLIGGTLALIQSGFTENWAPLPVTNMTHYLQGMALIIVISNLICYNLYGWLLKKFSATFISFAGLTTPLFAATFGYFFLGEKITNYFFMALGIIAVGLFIVYREERRLGYIQKNVIS